MRYLHARLEQPEWMHHPMQEFLMNEDAIQREELHAWNQSRDDVQFALFYVDGDVEAYRDRIEAVDPIRWFELTPVEEGAFYAYVCQEYTAEDVAFFEPFAELSLVVVPPLVYESDGQPRVTVVGPDDALTELVDSLRERSEILVEVLEVGTYDRRHGSVTAGLTDRQYEAVRTATEMGYYETPREASLADVAGELGRARGTVSELLRRAESNLMPRLLDAGGPTTSVE